MTSNSQPYCDRTTSSCSLSSEKTVVHAIAECMCKRGFGSPRIWTPHPKTLADLDVTLRQILEFPQKRNFHFRFGGNLDFPGRNFFESGASALTYSPFAETPTFDIFLAESLEKVVVSVMFFLTSVIVVNFGKF